MFIYHFVVLEYCLKYEEFITSSFFITLTTISIILIGYRVNKIEKVNDSKILLLVSMLLLYFSFIYCIGFFRGFLQNSYSLKLKHVFLNTICPLINLICLEMLRYMLLWSNKKNKSYYVILMITFTFIEILFNFNFYALNTLDGVFDLICLLIIKSFMDNFLLCYMTLNVGIKSCIIYRAFTSLYLYIMPIVPDLGTFIGTMFNVFLPFILWVYLNKIVSEEENTTYKEIKPKNNLLSNITLAISIILLIIMSGITPIKVLTVVTGSMQPVIDIGDIVLINSINTENIMVGDIIAFNHNGKTIVHRVYDIKDDNSYITKGDYNNDIDSFLVKKEDVIGKVFINIPYLGYPSIYFAQIMGGK